MAFRRPSLSLLAALLLCAACSGNPAANEQSGAIGAASAQATATSAAPPATDTPSPAPPVADSVQPVTRTVTVRLDPAQMPPATVAIYAEIPGEGPAVAGQSYFLVEGAGSEPLTLALPAAAYLIYGHSLAFEDISYFGVWGSEGGLAFVDGATVNEVLLQRPPDPCNPDYQLHTSPDGRFQTTDNPDYRMRYHCAAASATATSTSVAGPGESTLSIPLDGSGAAVYLQLDVEEAPADPATSDLWLYFQAGIDYLQAVNGARALPVAADMTLADCSQPSPQLFSADATPQGLQPGKSYCVYTNGSRLALVKITNRTDFVPKLGSSDTQGQSDITVVVEATEKTGSTSTSVAMTGAIW